MASRYSIIQYIPDPIADERINVGVLVFDENVVKVQFLQNWRRVKDFSLGDIDFLHDFEKEMNQATAKGLLFPGDRPTDEPNHERLQRVAESWMNSIQFTEPHASLKPIDKLFGDTIKKYLVEPIQPQKILRDRKKAISLTKKTFKDVITKRLGEKEVEHLLHSKHKIQGHHLPHTLDISVVNGRPHFAAQAISFEVRMTEQLINSVGFLVSDIKEQQPDFPIAIMTLPPQESQQNYRSKLKEYKETSAIYADLGATILGENNLADWVERKLELVH